MSFVDLAQHVNYWVALFDIFAFVIDLLLLLPLLLVKRLRGIIGSVYVITSYGFGLYIWIQAFVYVYVNDGIVWLIVGLLFFGLGVVPMALLGVLFSADWSGLGSMVTVLTVVFVTRIGGGYARTKYDEYISLTNP